MEAAGAAARRRCFLHRLRRVLRRCHRSVAYPAQSQEGEESTENSVQGAPRGGCLLRGSTGGQGLHPPTRLLPVGALHAGAYLDEVAHGTPWTPNDTRLACRCGPHVLWDVEVDEHTQGMSILVQVLTTATYTHWVSLYVLVVSWPYCLDMQGT